MSAENNEPRQAVHYSPEFVEFLQVRGHGVGKDETHLIPTTPEQLAEAERLTALVISFLKEPAFLRIATDIAGLTGTWFKEGLITEQQRMEIARTKERVVSGETAEEFAARINP